MKLVGSILIAFLLASACHAGWATIRQSMHGYGPARQQALDLYRPADGRRVPLILFVHGGGWSAGSRREGEGAQPAHFVEHGYAWASLDYRLVPDATVEDQAGDVARAIGWLVRHARGLHLDVRRILLVGHSSGAQLAGLIATDPRWLNMAGVPFDSLVGVISLDGAGVDLPGIIAAGAGSSHFYANAFGSDVARQTRLSPLTNLGPPDAPRWLLLYDQTHNQPAGFFADRFAAAARGAGVTVQVLAIAGTTHMGMLRDLGTPDDAATAAVDAFLADVMGDRSGRGKGD